MRISSNPPQINWWFIFIASLVIAVIVAGLSLLGITSLLDAGTITNLIGAAVGALAAVLSVLIAVDYATSRDQRQLAYYLHSTSCDLWNYLFLLKQTLSEIQGYGEPVSSVDAIRIAVAASEAQKAICRVQRNLDRAASNFFRLDFMRLAAIAQLEVLIDKAPARLTRIETWAIGQDGRAFLPTKFQADVEDMLETNAETNERFGG
ncbi:MAG TPA: hypothetical protein VGE33_11965 [Thermomonas sp.]